MKFHLVYKSKDKKGNINKIPVFFMNACKRQNVDFVGYDVCALGKDFTFSTLPELRKGDMVYRNAVSREAITIERIMFNENVTSFYTDWQNLNKARIPSWFTHVKLGLPVIPTYPGIPSNQKEMKDVINKLGSFPIVLKVTGGTLGVGVMRIDSMKSLQSVLDYFSLKNETVMLRKYIDHDYYVRAVVVGDEVVANHAAYVVDGEFRTNAGDDTDQKREVKDLSEDVKEIIVRAVKTLGIETGGVDLLFDNNDNPYIAEVNFPNNFKVTQNFTGVDIAGKMLEYLVKKTKKQV